MKEVKATRSLGFAFVTKRLLKTILENLDDNHYIEQRNVMDIANRSNANLKGNGKGAKPQSLTSEAGSDAKQPSHLFLLDANLI